MAIKTFAVGSPIPTAADFNTYLIQQQHVVKSADETLTNSTTLQNDDHLVLAVQANTRYWVQCFIKYAAATAADMAFRWTYPSGSTFRWISDALGGAATASTDIVSRTMQVASSIPNLGGATSPVFVVAPVKGLLTVGSTAGNLRVQWAQGVADPATNVMKAGSMISTRRL